MDYLITHYEKIITAFEDLLEALKTLCLHIHDELVNCPVWIDNGNGHFESDHDKVIYALQHFSPLQALSPQETFSCPGVIGATLETFALIKEVNHKKDELKKIAKDYLAIYKANPTRPVRQILANAGYGGIRLKQVYRHIRYINFHPRRISWTKAQTGSHLIINKPKASEMLLKVGKGEHIDIQLSKLNLLGDEDKLVIYRPIKPCWLANIATFKDKSGRSSHAKIRTSLPLFYLHDNHLPTPKVCFGTKQNRQQIKPRSDKAIEDVPFLKSINAYRYKSPSITHKKEPA